MAVEIKLATAHEVASVVASAAGLFATDAATHDPLGTDLGWAGVHGRAYYASLVADPGTLVLLAVNDDGEVAGHLVGRLREPSSVHPIRVAELESVHVFSQYRSGGLGTRLVATFLEWAGTHGADRATVTAFAANAGARRFYERHGFTSRTVTLDRDLADLPRRADSAAAPRLGS